MNESGGALPDMTYALRGAVLSDPIGPTQADPGAGYAWTRQTETFYGQMFFSGLGSVVW